MSADCLAVAVDSVPPDRVVVIADAVATTFGELADRSRRVARGLRVLGLRRGDRLALWLPNRVEWLVTLLACARLGVVAVAVNTRLAAAEVGDLMQRSAARGLVFAPVVGTRRLGDALAALPADRRAALEFVAPLEAGDVAPGLAPRVLPFAALQAGPALETSDARPEDALVVFTTSGTTSAPKLVLHAQRGIVRHAADVAAAFGFAAPDTVVLQALPLCGVFGFSQAMATLLAGRRLVLMAGFVADEAAALVRRHRATTMVGTNEMLDRMLDARDEDRPFPSLRFFGHATFNPALTDLPGKAEARGVRLRGLFGMSETLALFAIQPGDAALERRALAGGIPVAAAARVRVRDTATGALAAPGQAGEIELAGPSLFVGYLGDEAATRRAFTADGFFRTGDLGLALEDGGFTLLGRMGDTLRLGGILVNPLEIEAVIAADPRIAACQVVELARRDGLRAVAFVVLAPGATLDEDALIARCRAQLAPFKVPVRVVALERFPISDGPNGVKIHRAALRELAAARCAAAERPLERDG